MAIEFTIFVLITNINDRNQLRLLEIQLLIRRRHDGGILKSSKAVQGALVV